jgi:phosphoglycerate dehydrogenase-like enzyme
VPKNLHVLAPAMRWYHTATSGIDHLRFQPLWQTGVLLSSNCGVTGKGTIAEFVLALLLHASRRLSPQYSADVPYLGRRGELRTYPLAAADIAIVGTGGIGRAVEKVLSPLAGCLTLIGRDDDLEEGLKDANYVVVACPLTERTHAAIGERVAGLVSADCVIVNVARREIVDEAAIAATTAQGHLRGYWAEGYQCWSDPDNHLDHGPAAGRSIAIAPDYPLAKERWRLFEQALAHYVRTASPPRLVDRARMY